MTANKTYIRRTNKVQHPGAGRLINPEKPINTDSVRQPLRLRLARGCLGQLHWAERDPLGEMILKDHGEVCRELPAIGWQRPRVRLGSNGLARYREECWTKRLELSG